MLGKPKIGIDIDGCIAYMLGDILIEAKERFGIEIKQEEVVRFNLVDNGLTRPQVEEIIYDWDVIENLPEMPFAREAIEVLWEDYEIHVVSARKHDSTKPTKLWLQRHEIKYDVLALHHFDKAKYVQEKNLIWFIEDRYKNAIEISDHCHVFMFDKPYNDRETNGNITRIHSWQEILGIIYED